jgi:hypothetical protein
MSWKEVLDIILVVGLFGSLFNLFVGAEMESSGFKERNVFIVMGLLYVLEIVGCYYMLKWDRESAEDRRRTAYVIHIEPNGETCEGRYYSGKNSPITVKCLDGRTYIAQSIQIIKEIKLKHPVN